MNNEADHSGWSMDNQLWMKQVQNHKEVANTFQQSLNDAVYLFHERYDPWVKTIGGVEYSDTMASGFYFLLRFIGKNETDLPVLFSTNQPKYAHLLWRTISAIDDAVDEERIGSVRGISAISDEDNVPVTRMIKELTSSLWRRSALNVLTKSLLIYTRHHESRQTPQFEDAVRVIKRTTGAIAKLGAMATYRLYSAIYPSSAQIPFDKFMNQAVAASYTIQLLDDMNDFSVDYYRPRSSSLVLAACRDTGELEKVKNLHANNIPINGESLIANNISARVVLFDYYMKQRQRLGNAPNDMVRFFDYQVLHTSSA